MNKPQNVNVLDDSVTDDGQETSFVCFRYSLRETCIYAEREKVSRCNQIISSKKNYLIRYCINNQHTCSG